MDELHPEVRAYLDSAKKAIRDYFASRGEKKSDFEVLWEERIEALSKDERKALISLLKRSLKGK